MYLTDDPHDTSTPADWGVTIALLVCLALVAAALGAGAGQVVEAVR